MCVCVCVDLDLADLHVLPRQVFSHIFATHSESGEFSFDWQRQTKRESGSETARGHGGGGGSIGHTDRGSDVKEKSTNTHILLVFAHTFLVDGLVFKSLTLNFERI